MAARTPAMGTVMIQERMMPPMTRMSRAPMPRAIPTPITAPTAMWVVDTGMPTPDATTTTIEAATVAA